MMRVERCGRDYAWRAYPFGRPWMSRIFDSWQEAMDYANEIVALAYINELPEAPFGKIWEVYGDPDLPWIWTSELTVIFDEDDVERNDPLDVEWYAIATAGNGFAILIDDPL